MNEGTLERTIASDLDYQDIVQVKELTFDLPPGEEDQLTAEQTNFLSAAQHGSRPAVDGPAGYAAVDAAERVVRAIKEHKWEGLKDTSLLVDNTDGK